MTKSSLESLEKVEEERVNKMKGAGFNYDDDADSFTRDYYLPDSLLEHEKKMREEKEKKKSKKKTPKHL